MRGAVIIVVVALLGAGCTTAGPFVTGISSDGRGGLMVEKCMAKLNGFTTTIGNSECTSTSVHLGTPLPAKH